MTRDDAIPQKLLHPCADIRVGLIMRFHSTVDETVVWGGQEGLQLVQYHESWDEGTLVEVVVQHYSAYEGDQLTMLISPLNTPDITYWINPRWVEPIVNAPVQ